MTLSSPMLCSIKDSLTVPGKFKCLPYFHWLPKLHKTPYGSRFIAASSRCTTTLVSKILTACLDLVRKRQQVYYEAIYRNSSIKGYWLFQNTSVHLRSSSRLSHRLPRPRTETLRCSPFYCAFSLWNSLSSSSELSLSTIRCHISGSPPPSSQLCSQSLSIFYLYLVLPFSWLFSLLWRTYLAPSL